MWNGKINYFRGFKNFNEVEEKFEKAREIYKDRPGEFKDIKDEFLFIIMGESRASRNLRLSTR